MENKTPQLISEAEFNKLVQGWTISTRRKFITHLPKNNNTGSVTEQKLSKSINYQFRKNYGAISRIKYKFPRHGIFYHYGVGRGYIRQGNLVTRGSKTPGRIMLTLGFKRKPVDWFDVEIKQGIKHLADIAVDYYGDMVLENMLAQMDKALIEKK